MEETVKKIYGAIATGEREGCCGPKSCDCANTAISEKMGYTKEDLQALPEDAVMGLGCGNPVALASLKKGETVVDLGAGGGIDAFLASRIVGDSGKVIGIDMTEAMIKRARTNAKKGRFTNVEFKLGDIEEMPLEDGIADCVISNCVINLAQDKQNVFNEAFRILKQGGRLMVADMVLLRDLSEKIAKSAEMYAGCVAGALKRDDYIAKIKKAGFKEISVIKEDPVRFLDYIGSDKVLGDLVKNMSDKELEEINSTVMSIKISATK
ncbi:MAG: arsenite methyltransferase [Lentisphaerae bacterium]|nr:arsenite methyltransferase [Lentisphaerota bacterium]